MTKLQLSLRTSLWSLSVGSGSGMKYVSAPFPDGPGVDLGETDVDLQCLGMGRIFLIMGQGCFF